ncbi:MAG: hypothetical protein KF847_12500 [Pirellulales bacterium]|nr:hypothetical protein [Pirellulales bacterium]
MNAVLLIHAASTWAMAGLIWFVQLVHYPLFARVGAAGFVEYERLHCRRTTWVVAPLMLAELASAAWLALAPSSPAPVVVAWLGLALVVALWLSTALVQAPLHGRLSQGYDDRTAQKLTTSNWFRTLAWSVRGIVALACLG